jgi:hypothetical protein
VVQAFVKQSQHARVLLYVPSQGDQGPTVGMVMDSLHSRIGQTLGVLVVHAGGVVDKVKTASPELRPGLFLPDGSHQSASGAYLQALVLYTTLTQKSPVGLPHPVLPGLTDSLATHYERLVAEAVLPHAQLPTTLVSHALPRPVVVVELYTDRSCAACAAAEAAVIASARSHAIPQATVVPLVWPVGVTGLPTSEATRPRLAAVVLAVKPGATAAAPPAPLDTTSLVLPTVMVDGVPTPVGSLAQAIARATQHPHPWVTAATLDGTNLAVIVAPVPTAAPTDSLDVWAVVTEDLVVPHGAAPTLSVVRAAQRLKTVSVQQGVEDAYDAPALPPNVVRSRIHVMVLVQMHGTGRIVGEAEVPLMAYTGDRP